MPQITISGDNISISATDCSAPMAISYGLIPPIGGRLSLISRVSISESDVAGATTIFYVPLIGNSVAVFNGTDFEYLQIASQLWMPLDPTTSDVGYHQAGKTFDLFCINNGGSPQLVTGSAWSSDFVHGSGTGTTELESFAGLLVNKNPLANARFGADTANVVAVPARQATCLGSFTASGNGLATDSKAKRLLFNAYNQAYRPMGRCETAASWVYNTDAVRQANGNAANQIEFLIGLPGVCVDATLSALASCSGASGTVAYAGIGLDSVTQWATDSIPCRLSLPAGQGALPFTSFYRGMPGMGRHVLTWLERARGVVDTTWYGTSGSVTDFKAGIIGGLMA